MIFEVVILTIKATLKTTFEVAFLACIARLSNALKKIISIFYWWSGQYLRVIPLVFGNPLSIKSGNN
jgi:hypothetical protein